MLIIPSWFIQSLINQPRRITIFYTVLLGKEKALTSEQKRFYSCIHFVADKCVPVAFYLHDDWVKSDLLRTIGIQVPPFNSELPKLVYISHQDWDSRPENENKLPVKTPKNEFLLSEGIVNKLALEQQGINSSTAILCLAAVGLDLMLPNISFDLMAEEEIQNIKETLQEDRVEYLTAITSIADETYERIKIGDYKDMLNWAQNEFSFKLAPKARVLEKNVRKVKEKELKKAGLSFWKEGIPAIGQAYINGGTFQACKVTGEEALKQIVSILGKNVEERNLPEVAYAVKIAKMKG